MSKSTRRSIKNNRPVLSLSKHQIHAEEGGEARLPTRPSLTAKGGTKKAFSIENARFAFNCLRDFYRIFMLRCKVRVNLRETSRLMMISEERVMRLFLRTLCWVASTNAKLVARKNCCSKANKILSKTLTF